MDDFPRLRRFCRTAALLIPTLLCGLPGLHLAAASEAPGTAEPELSDPLQERLTVLMNDAELAAYRKLETPAQREAFLRGLWYRRDTAPATATREQALNWRQNLAGFRQQLSILAVDDRALVMNLFGTPTQRDGFAACDNFRPLEAWYYSPEDLQAQHIPGAPPPPDDGIYLLFAGYLPEVDSRPEFKLWAPAQGGLPLMNAREYTRKELMALDLTDIRSRLSQLIAWGDGLGCNGTDLEVTDRFRRALQGSLPLSALLALDGFPAPPADGYLEPLLAASRAATAEQVFPGQLEVRYPGSLEGSTVLQGRVLVPLTALGVERPEELLFASLGLTGQVLREGQVADSFRYQFNGHGHLAGDNLELSFYRQLQPGAQTLEVSLTDRRGFQLLRQRLDLDVPAAEDVVPSIQESKLQQLTATDVVAFQDAYSLHLRGPSSSFLAVGAVHVDAFTTGIDIARVDFSLDGQPVGSATEAPFGLDIDLGPAPREHVVEAVAVDHQGRKRAGDQLRINDSPRRFAVRLLEPAAGSQPEDTVRVQAAVEAPHNRKLDRVELYLGDDLAATLYQPPFLQQLALPEEKPAYVRAVAYLTDGTSTEDTVLLYTTAVLDAVDVSVVELFTTVTSGSNHTATDLPASAFHVFEDGAEQQLQRFEVIDNLPVNVALVIDTSDSMATLLPAVRKSALSFLDSVLTERDQGSLIQFNSQISLLVPLTGDIERLRQGAESLGAATGTRFYDAVVLGLYYLSGLEGKRAMVVLTDGLDEHSQFTFDQMREFALRSGVAIYQLVFPHLDRLEQADPRNWTKRTMDPELNQRLEALSNETGGRLVHIPALGVLDHAYQAISEELRSQYLLVYQSAHDEQPGGQDETFRRVEVKVDGNLQARTRAGYYP